MRRQFSLDSNLNPRPCQPSKHHPFDLSTPWTNDLKRMADQYSPDGQDLHQADWARSLASRRHVLDVYHSHLLDLHKGTIQIWGHPQRDFPRRHAIDFNETPKSYLALTFFKRVQRSP